MLNNIVVIHQPDFIPYIGFFHKLLNSNLYVILDDVQFLRQGWHHRDKIKTLSGEKWLTISIKHTSQNTQINQVYLSTEVNWKENHLNLIKDNYKKTPFFKEFFPYIEEIYNYKTDKLSDFNINAINLLASLFQIETKQILSSELQPEGKNNELLVNILSKVKATHYLSGIGAKDYFEPEPFEKENIIVKWQEFKHPVYPQIYGDFIPYLSSIDLFFNCGIEKSREILRSI